MTAGRRKQFGDKSSDHSLTGMSRCYCTSFAITRKTSQMLARLSPAQPVIERPKKKLVCSRCREGRLISALVDGICRNTKACDARVKQNEKWGDSEA